MLVDVDAAFFVAEEELCVREAEHAEGFLAVQTVGDVANGGVLGVWDAHGYFLVECHELEAFEGGDGDVGVEEVDGEAFGWDIELVEFAEELSVASSEFLAEQAALLFRRFLEHGF